MRWWVIIAIVLVVAGCKREEPVKSPAASEAFALDIPVGFPAPLIPEDNQLSHAKVELGERLFFDPHLSSDNSISCATCHQPQLSFAESHPISEGVNQSPGIRNAPSLANVAYQEALFAEGGIPSLELQAVAPITEAHEMNLDLDELMHRLESDESYVQQFQKAYHSPPTTQSTVKALASFQRTLLSGNSRFDQYYYQGKTNVLNESEINGMDLFFSDEVGCASCHSGFLFTDQSFQNIGLYNIYEDEGLARLTGQSVDIGKFKVPSLRNIGVTAPYMHNGSIETLAEVVDHFNAGGTGHDNQNKSIRSLDLDEQQKADLVNFLKTLTDESFVNNPDFH